MKIDTYSADSGPAEARQVPSQRETPEEGGVTTPMDSSSQRLSSTVFQVLLCSVLALGSLRFAFELMGIQPTLRPPEVTGAHAEDRGRIRELRIGSLAPDFTLRDIGGKEFRLEELSGRRVLLNFLCGCLRCAQLSPEWEKIHRQGDTPRVFGITGMEPDQARSWCESMGITFPVLIDPNHMIAKVYSSTTCPRSWLIDEQGHVKYGTQVGATPRVIAAALHDQLAVPEHPSVRHARRP